MHAIKYFHRKDLVPPLTEALTPLLSDTTHAVLVPIPMPRLRKMIRGYNHSEYIAKILSKTTHIPVRTDIIVRKNYHTRQVMTSSRYERLHNQHNTFLVLAQKEDLANITIILVDDVTTTGATLKEARDTLLKHGANSVEAVTIAH